MDTRKTVEKLFGMTASDSPEAVAEMFAPSVGFTCAVFAPWIRIFDRHGVHGFRSGA